MEDHGRDTLPYGTSERVQAHIEARKELLNLRALLGPTGINPGGRHSDKGERIILKPNRPRSRYQNDYLDYDRLREEAHKDRLDKIRKNISDKRKKEKDLTQNIADLKKEKARLEKELADLKREIAEKRGALDTMDDFGM